MPTPPATRSAPGPIPDVTITRRQTAGLWLELLDQARRPGFVDHYERRMPIRAGQIATQEERVNAVVAWHRRVLSRATLYHFSAPLWGHALDCEADFPSWQVTRHDLPEPYGFIALERPTAVKRFRVSALSWGLFNFQPGTGVWFNKPESYDMNRDADAESWTAWIVTAWAASPTARLRDRDGRFFPMIDYVFYPEDGPFRPRNVEHHTDGPMAIPRTMKIAFDIATLPRAASVDEDRIARSLTKRAGVARRGPADIVRVIDLRPKLAQAVGTRGSEGQTVGRVDANYRVKCWPVRPSIDPATGELRKRGYIAYRNPALLEAETIDPIRVWSGTDV